MQSPVSSKFQSLNLIILSGFSASDMHPHIGPQYYGRCNIPPQVPPHKSAEDITLSTQFQNQCRMTNSPRHQQQV